MSTTARVALRDDSSPTTTTRTTPTTTSITRSETATSSLSTSVATTAQNTGTTQHTSLTPSQTNSSTTTTTVTATPSSSSDNKGALIGGIVGAIIGGLVIIALVIALIYWRRRRKGQRFTLLRWRDPHSDEKSGVYDGPDDASTADGFAGAGKTGSYKDSPKHQSITPSDNGTTAAAASNHGKDGSPSLNSPTFTAPSSNRSRHNSGMPLISDDPCPLLAGTPLVPSTELPGSTPGTGFTPELPDTPRSHGPAELALDPLRELINIPAPLRHTNANNETTTTTTTPPWKSSIPSSLDNQPPLVMTADGAIMRANLNPSQFSLGEGGGTGGTAAAAASSIRHSGGSNNSNGSSRRHVMSFMQYDNYDDGGGQYSDSRRESSTTGVSHSQRTTMGTMTTITTPIPEISISPPMADDERYKGERGTEAGSKSRADGLGLGLSGTELTRTQQQKPEQSSGS
ncbi:hypothetical protein VTN00DRAFT_6961 [Thermoascus crustaceus]|uniref:uncharacterized protein n=1 Tax=Thermoascus crustaceus TaxID=5088 RepID=UPI003743ED18